MPSAPPGALGQLGGHGGLGESRRDNLSLRREWRERTIAARRRGCGARSSRRGQPRDRRRSSTTPGDGTGTARRIIPLDPRDLGLAPGDARAPEQRPYAAVLGCSDARVPIELIFNEGPNDLFVVRVAGNGLGSEVLGSLKYAVDHLGGSLKLIVVLGHSGCGAVSAAVDVFLEPGGLPFAGREALAARHPRPPAGRRSCGGEEDGRRTRPGRRAAGRLSRGADRSDGRLECGARRLHGAAGARRGAAQGLRAAYGVYLLADREIWAPRSGSAECGGLAYPPADAGPSTDFADAVVRSERIVALLAQRCRIATAGAIRFHRTPAVRRRQIA